MPDEDRDADWTPAGRADGFWRRLRRPAPARCWSGPQRALAKEPGKAQIAITLDLEMSRNFPVWEEMRWDFEKGNLNDETKRYTVEACRRVKNHGGVLHTFAVGRVCEQENVDWLKEIAAAGHPIGNHTYDHVNVLATRAEDIQFRFKRRPVADRRADAAGGDSPRTSGCARWRSKSESVSTRSAFARRAVSPPVSPNDPTFRRSFLDQGFSWVSCLYPPHPVGEPRQAPTDAGARRYRRRAGQGPAVCLSDRAGRGADESDQRRRRVSQRPLAAGVPSWKRSAARSRGPSTTARRSTFWRIPRACT